ncbi:MULTISPECIES: hypothetical protein [unclassified Aureispira]|uniref:hypothetical protein n=1 Tax=unclassified Aureispira TaxID=2649989 RepID=UPI000695AC2D|nr:MULTISPECIES: hypothetical protein [unclassified Aureispira]WMX16846.1 hypothetical protein QP953_10735 [Aureispira sp. CCB-E]
MKDIEKEQKNLLELINSWDEKNIRLAMLIWQNDSRLEQYVQEQFKALLQAKDYKSLVGLRLLANLNSMNSDDMEESLQYMLKVRWLKLNHNILDAFPIPYLRDLEQLKIISTTIVNLPKSVGHLHSLTVLDLSGCRNLSSFPPEVLNLKYLTEIHLTGTAIGEQHKISILVGSNKVQAFLQSLFN